MAVSDDDWRLQGQERYLTGVVLHHACYSPPRPDWDHDHCEFFHAKFMDIEHPDVLHEGYTTDNQDRWICPQCFKDFRERFQWSLR